MAVRKEASKKTNVGQATRSSKRPPGRPLAQDNNNISKESIIRTALAMSRKTPLQDLSIVMVAKQMEVTPALIHYYIEGRDWLTSGIMNRFYKELLRKWPKPTGDWESDLVAAAELIFEQFVRYAGIAAYVVTHSRFRIFQLTLPEEVDYGVEMLEKFAGVVRSSGLSSQETGTFAHLIMEFLISASNGATHNIYPRDHTSFLEEKANDLDPEKYPNIHFCKKAPFELGGRQVFERGCYLFILGIRQELTEQGAS